MKVKAALRGKNAEGVELRVFPMSKYYAAPHISYVKTYFKKVRRMFFYLDQLTKDLSYCFLRLAGIFLIFIIQNIIIRI